MSNLMTCQIVTCDIEATLVLKDGGEKKGEVFGGTGP